MLELYQSDGIIAEPAGAWPRPDGPLAERGACRPRVACVVSGGNNDVSRYAEVIERSLVHGDCGTTSSSPSRRSPARCAASWTPCWPREDIVVFEYLKKSNRETGPALIGVDLEDAASLPGLVARMDASGLAIEPVPVGSPFFSFLH